MKVNKILPNVKRRFDNIANSILEPIRVKRQIEILESNGRYSIKGKYRPSFEEMNMPVVLSGKAKEAVDKCNTICNDAYGGLSIRSFACDDKVVIVSKNREDKPLIHFDFYDKSGARTDTVAISYKEGVQPEKSPLSPAQNMQPGQICGYHSFNNNVMRPRDPLYNSWRDMTLEETLHVRPVIVKRINSLLEKVATVISK